MLAAKSRTKTRSNCYGTPTQRISGLVLANNASHKNRNASPAVILIGKKYIIPQVYLLENNQHTF